jgi:hypothetical protein
MDKTMRWVGGDRGDGMAWLLGLVVICLSVGVSAHPFPPPSSLLPPPSSCCLVPTTSYSSMIHYKYGLIRRVARRLKGLAKGGAKAKTGTPLTVEQLMRQEGWCVGV